jgi:hypothetical protein
VGGTQTPARVPLTGADCFLRAFDHEIRRNAGASHVSQLVLRLGPGLDVDALRKGLHEAAHAQPILRAPIRRRFGLGPPDYQLARAGRRAPPTLQVHDREPCATPFVDRLNAPRDLRRGELLRFDVAMHRDGSADLTASWAHLLLDGSGSERFLTWLDACHRGVASSHTLPDPDELDRSERPELSARERGARAVAWQRWMDGLGGTPMRSPAGPLRRTRQALDYDVLALEHDEAERATARARERAGFLTPMLFYLACAVRAHHAVFRERGVDPGRYIVPLPVNVRPRGREGALFRTHTSLLWFSIDPADVDDFETLLEALKRQRLEAIRAGHVENGIHAMDYARWAPRRLYARMARAALSGELCSFFFAYTGEFVEGLDHFFGAPVRDGYHVPPVPPSPGSCAAFSHFRGRLNATHVHQQGVFSDRERALFAAQLRTDLAG